MIGALGATELALQMAGVPIKKGGTQAAMESILADKSSAVRKAAE
jgi:alanine-glyoxylate transaminase/serine-glyoxylate transaminase/serine-pyruvate transaminase